VGVAIVTDLRTIEGGPRLTEGNILDLERRFGFALPRAYRSFVLRTNGGRPERDLFPVPGFQRNPIGRIHFFFGINDPVESCNLDWNKNIYSGRIPSTMLPIATTEGADKICLAVMGDELGAVYYWDGYAEGRASANLYPVAESFDKFVDLLWADAGSPRL
jgi:SMI1/KNR4 family protein SUKH-1